MIYSVTKSSNHTITRVALNSKGGVLDLTGATISVTVKQFGNSSTTLFTKTNASSSEIEVLDVSRGIFLLKLVPSNTSGLSDRTLYCSQSIVKGSTTYTDIFYIKIKGNNVNINGGDAAVITEIRHGTTAERTAYGLTLTSTDRVSYFDDDDNAPYWWDGSAWV